MDTDRFNLIANDPAAFRSALLIDTDDGPQPLAEMMDDWQRQDFEALDPGWRRAAGQSVEGGYQRAFVTRPRGHSKTGDAAAMAVWTLLAARRPLQGFCCAADLDQAKIIRHSVASLLAANPWLSVLQAQQNRVINRATGSELTVLASDAPTSYGIRPAFIIADELVCWQSDALWTSLFSSAAKRRNCLLVVITNAGFTDSWQHALYEAAEADENWYTHSLDGPQASWISQETLNEQRRLLPPSAFARLWGNTWCAAEGDAIPAADIWRCVVLDGPMPYRQGDFSGAAIGCDLGFFKDHSALIVALADFERQKIVIGQVQDFGPPVLEATVRQAIIDASQRFNTHFLFIDPWQAIGLSQELTQLGFQVISCNPTPKRLSEQSVAVRESIREQYLQLYDDGPGCPGHMLIDDLLRVQVTDTGFGERLVLANDQKTGHGDRLAALANLMPAALRTLAVPPRNDRWQMGPYAFDPAAMPRDKFLEIADRVIDMNEAYEAGDLNQFMRLL